MRLFLFCVLLLSSLFGGAPMAQTGNPAAATDRSLSQQFEEMIQASNRYQNFRVVRQDYLAAFIENVNDSLSGYTERIATLEGTIDTQEGRIGAQQSEIDARDASINQLRGEKDSVSLLGLQLSKATYSLIMWALVLGLLAAFLVAMASTRVAVTGAADLRRERDKLTTELEQSRKSRLAVEQDLRRKLQDEINRNRGGTRP